MSGCCNNMVDLLDLEGVGEYKKYSGVRCDNRPTCSVQPGERIPVEGIINMEVMEY